MYRQWRHTATEGQPFANPNVDTFVRWLIRRPRPPYVVRTADAGFALDFSADVEADQWFPSTGPVEDRLTAFEYAANAMVKMRLKAQKSTDERIHAVEVQRTRSDQEITDSIRAQEQQRVRDATNDIRNAGWGLVFAVIGRLIQFVASYF